MDTQKTVVEVVTVTPEMAQKWLTENRYEFQRDIRNAKVAFLAEEMKRGAFKQGTPIEFSGVNGNEWLTDGQHRLAAVVWAKTPQEFIVSHRHLDDEKQVALDYTRTDQVTIRSIFDSYKTLRLAEELGLTPTQLKNLGVAVSLIDRKFNQHGATMHPDDRLRLMREYNDAYGAYLESIAGSRKELRYRLDRGATVSVALVTFRYSANVYGAKVDEFWNGIGMDDGLRKGDARKIALTHLTEMGMIGSNYSATSKKVSPPFSSRCLAVCFNAYMKGKEMFKQPRPNTAEPLMILGSPFN